MTSFVSYSHADADLVRDLLGRLRLRLNRSTEFGFESWDDSTILAGEDWAEQIEKAIDDSDLGLLFVSYAFLDSDFIVRRELPRFLTDDLKRPIPVGLRPVRFDATVDLGGLEKRQFFRDRQGRCYGELTTDMERDLFADDLFDAVLCVARKYCMAS